MVRLYSFLFLRRPFVALFFTLLIILGTCRYIPDFKLDASADSLVLENDQSLRYFREIYAQYGSNDYLVLTYTPHDELFSQSSLTTLKNLRNEIRELDGVQSVVSILDVPLLFSPTVSLGSLAEGVRTLETQDTDKELAQKEFQTNPLYKDQLLSPDGKTTALLVNLPVDGTLKDLLRERTQLRVKEFNETITQKELKELEKVSGRYRQRLTQYTEKENLNVAEIRSILQRYKGEANLFLGGVPMIIADMISFIKSDLVIFSLGVLLFLIITLATIFRKKRWVFLPMVCCSAAGLSMIGILAYMDWRVTVISSNFISLMLIITMSLTIHLIVRYRELCVLMPEADQRTLVLETVRLKALPCLYTTLTTIVAFTSLLVSSIRPVMDFGLMMTIGLIVSYVLSFALLPTGAMLVKREHITPPNKKSKSFTLLFAQATEEKGRAILALASLLTLFSIIGINKLKVENRFIDYFRSSTEIFQGMKLIDQKLGGTTPLDLIIDLRDDTSTTVADEGDLLDVDLGSDTKIPGDDSNTTDSLADTTDLLDDDLLADSLLDEDINSPSEDNGFQQDRYWFTAYKMEQIDTIHTFLDDLPETGKVLSLSTLIRIATALNNNIPLDDYELAILYDKLPDSIKDMLITPYLSIPQNQIRLTMRVMESDRSLSRANLLKKIHSFLTETMHFKPEQIHFTNMLVLYNNMLQSLFRSQILTIGVVFLGIMLMFLILFRSLKVSLIAIAPNLLPAAMILGFMGWFNIPLDMMTITIAAITIGIAVDDTIHYIHRFEKEFQKDKNYLQTMYRCHGSIGHAMYYTSLTIIIGFSILVLSNFIPTVYFGLFTGFGMFAALVAALTLLPKLILVFKPFGPEEAL